MDYKQAEKYALSRPDVYKEYPFGPQTAVFKVKKKMFALLGICGKAGKELGSEFAGYAFLNLKCDPDEAFMLRDIFPEILPAYHMSKKHWISVVLKPTMPEKEIERLIDRSYALVVKKLTKAERTQLELTYSPTQLYR
ncbi:MmcQ/YjbR family DNA-binding protein [Neptuniibacter sp. 1_MG-2023]|uniref:MmcQ/YjbR family DNA-binding protein n=1 Tax=Neptuniibacter sp. 1_MG-2023 TaxID=3062662 RepID=UPI0026E28551|nr:MmcQ/YjbR family DNA-binding protein [Neptuniibacter sp. 1_MG-2023]MDO6593627.1 MmcQ/YjbR family DNA-binding protein [Neptuniibacter sp. 1_MG-2023]